MSAIGRNEAGGWSTRGKEEREEESDGKSGGLVVVVQSQR